MRTAAAIALGALAGTGIVTAALGLGIALARGSALGALLAFAAGGWIAAWVWEQVARLEERP